MIDFVNVRYHDKDKLEGFVLNQENFKEVFVTKEYHSQIDMYPYKANFENMEISITETQAVVKNSIHKLFNILSSKKDHNYNDFHYSQICLVIDYLKDKILDVNRAKLTQLEFGFNIEIPVKAEELIRQSVLMHKLDGYTLEDNFDGKGYLKSFVYNDFLIKIYDKSKQFGIRQKNILRVEIKHRKSKAINRFGIFNLEDLKDKVKLELLFLDLLKRFGELTIVDSYQDRDDIPDEVKTKLDAFSSFNYWQAFNNGQTKMVHKRKYEKLLEEYNLLKIKAKIKTQLIDKFQELINS